MNKVIDKHGLLNRLITTKPLVLELGCGPRKRNPAAIGIDLINYSGVDFVGDVFEVLEKFPVSCVDSVFANHFVEHVSDINKLMLAVARVLKVDGSVELVAPHFSNPYFYSDPTHKSFFGLYTFCYLSVGASFSRKVPSYQQESLFKLESVDLIFKSSRPFFIRYFLKSLVGKIFNSSNFLKELYEENFCYIFPCYEIRYILSRIEK
jgi:ubiquinone/menaquinone biosynthesis C-methylase UbiE